MSALTPANVRVLMTSLAAKDAACVDFRAGSLRRGAILWTLLLLDLAALQEPENLRLKRKLGRRTCS